MSGPLKFKHNKRRNAGIVYELLVRRLGKSMLDGDQLSYQRALGIIRKYYSEDAPLAEERELFEVVRGSRGLSESAARRVLVEVQRHAAKMDAHRVDIKKSCLIKEINYTLGRDLFDEHRIPDYRLLATIQMVIDACRQSSVLTESVSGIQLEEGLVRYMTTKGSYSTAPVKQTDVDALVMRMAVKRFDEKYSKTLGSAQKALLERYIRFQVTGESKLLEEAIFSEQRRIHELLKSARDRKEFNADPEMMKKLNEADESFDRVVVPGQGLDRQVEDLMLFQKLAEEMESVDE